MQVSLLSRQQDIGHLVSVALYDREDGAGGVANGPARRRSCMLGVVGLRRRVGVSGSYEPAGMVGSGIGV